MNYNEFSNGTKIIDDKNAIAQLPTVLVGLGASRVLLLGNPHLNENGYIDKVKTSVEKNGKLTVSAVYLGDDFSDGESFLVDLYFVYMSNNCDSIVVCGEGRLIDYAKALKLLVATQVKDIKSFYNSKVDAREIIYIPLITIPSQFGSGTETNSCAVVYDSEKGVSRNIIGDILSPDYCIVDGALIAQMDKTETAYGIIEIFARALDGYTVTEMPPIAIDAFAKMYDDYIELQVAAISDEFCRVALTDLRSKGADILEDPSESKFKKMELRGAYLSKGTDSSGLGLINCIAQAIADVKGTQYSNALPKAIKLSFEYNKDVCKNKYSKCLLAFSGWQKYADAVPAKRHEIFIADSIEFLDGLSEKFFDGKDKLELNDEEKQKILNNMVYNVNVLNNPRKFNATVFKTLL